MTSPFMRDRSDGSSSCTVQTTGTSQLCHAHIDDIVLLEVDLGWRTSPFENDDVILCGKRLIAFSDDRHQLFNTPQMVVGGTHVAPYLASNDHLRRHVAGWLEEYRVHMDRRRGTRSLCLQRLGAADLEAFDRRGRVERHILRFERSDADTVIREDAA
jgi:hypothetical protein